MDKAAKDLPVARSGNELKSLLRRIIESRHGEKQSWTAGRMAAALGIKGNNADRKVRAMILELIWKEDLAVLATTGKPPGFFTPETWAEWEEYDRVQKSRIAEDAKRRVKVKRNVHALFEGTVKVRML
jgi:hypothetical protein